MKSSRAAPLLRNLALASVSSILFGGLIEGLARAFEPPPVQKEEYLWDWAERFKDGDFYTLEKGEGYPPSEETSVDGLRDVTRPIETREGLRRIVILGDSVAYGHGLEASESFPLVLELSLRASGHDVDVFNVGLPGWSTRQERLAYERIARKYKPNAVVLAVCLNDLAELQINLARPSGFLFALFKHSATIRMALGASRREIGAVEELFSAANTPRVENAFALFFEEVAALRASVLKDGAAFHLAVLPFRFQVEPSAPAPSVQKRIGDFAAAQGMSFLDFLPEVLKAPAPADLFLDYDHFSVRGHVRIAAWLASRPEIVGNPLRDERSGSPGGVALSATRLLADAGRAASEKDREFAVRRVQTESLRMVSKGAAELTALTIGLVAMAVDDPSPRVRFEAARTVFHLGLPDAAAVDPLIRGLLHDDPRVRAFATWTLGEMGELARPALPALVALARRDGGAGRTGALTAIGKIGGDSPETIPLLLQELKHPKEARRYRAARTLGRMGPAAAPAVNGLAEALRDPSALVRLHVVRAFGNIGEGAKASVPALIQVLNHDPDSEVRKEVSLTLSKLPGR